MFANPCRNGKQPVSLLLTIILTLECYCHFLASSSLFVNYIWMKKPGNEPPQSFQCLEVWNLASGQRPAHEKPVGLVYSV